MKDDIKAFLITVALMSAPMLAAGCCYSQARFDREMRDLQEQTKRNTDHGPIIAAEGRFHLRQDGTLWVLDKAGRELPYMTPPSQVSMTKEAFEEWANSKSVQEGGEKYVYPYIQVEF